MKNIKLITKRLTLIPLSEQEMQLLSRDIPSLEKALSLKYRAEPMEGHMLRVIRIQLDNIKEDMQDILWYTFWLLTLTDEKTAIGSICFKGPPNKAGNVELGYGVSKKYENKGYTTEAVKAITRWALQQEKVKNIVAETEKDNIASQTVLRKCGFARYKETTACNYWMLRGRRT